MTLTILSDMDGICVDLLQHWLDAIVADYGPEYRVAPTEITRWDMHDCGALRQLGAKRIYSYLQKPDFFLSAPPLAGALEGLRQLHDSGHDVLIVSSPSGSVSAAEKFLWLEQKLPWLPRKNIILANRKTLVRGDVLIDDHPETLCDYSKAWPGKLCLGIGYPYNESLRARSSSGDMAYPKAPRLCGDYTDPGSAWKLILAEIRAYAEVQDLIYE